MQRGDAQVEQRARQRADALAGHDLVDICEIPLRYLYALPERRQVAGGHAGHLRVPVYAEHVGFLRQGREQPGGMAAHAQRSVDVGPLLLRYQQIHRFVGQDGNVRVLRFRHMSRILPNFPREGSITSFLYFDQTCASHISALFPTPLISTSFFSEA